MISQPRNVLPDIANTKLKLSVFNKAMINSAKDYSVNGKDGTITSEPKPLPKGGYSLDGGDDKIDFEDIGNIQAIEFWISPQTTTQEILLVDTGNDIMVSGGTITYTGLTSSATYINGAAGTTLAATEWSHVISVFSQIDANNFEVGTDGSNFGQFKMKMLNVYDEILSASFSRFQFLRSCPEG